MVRISIAGSASPAETAAISAAIERFLGDTAAAAPPAGPELNPWLTAALVEGVGSKDSFGPADPRELF